MADTMFIIELGREQITGVYVQERSGITIVLGCASVDITKMSIDQAAALLKEQSGATDGRCQLIIDPGYFFFRNLSLPFLDKKKISQILPFELAENTPLDPESLLIDFKIRRAGPDGAEIIAAMLPKDLLRRWIPGLIQAGIDPDRVGISGTSISSNIFKETKESCFYHLDIHVTHANLCIFEDGRLALFRSIRAAGSINGESVGREVVRTIYGSRLRDSSPESRKLFLTGDTSLHESIAGYLNNELSYIDVQTFTQCEQPFVKVSEEVTGRYRPDTMDRALAAAVSGRRDGFEFRKGEFKRSRSNKAYKRKILQFTVPALFALFFFVFYQGYIYQGLQEKYDKLRTEVAAVFTTTVSGVTRVVNPVQQLQVINNSIRETYKAGSHGTGGGYSMILLLTEISARIPASYKVKIVRFVADTDTIRMKGITSNFNTVDNVQKELEKSTYFSGVDISSANQSPQGDEIRFELKMKLSR